MIILLLDMDGVLLEPQGYHRALVDTVKAIGRSLGFQKVEVRPQDIVAFEAAGISSEWESAAACAALMLVRRWQQNAEIAFPANLAPCCEPSPGLNAPDFEAFAHSLDKINSTELTALQRIETAVIEQAPDLSPGQVRSLQNLIRNATAAEQSLLHRTFQEFVLGSQIYAEVYSYPAALNTDSYLLRFDRPNLSPIEQAELRQWLVHKERAAAVLTLRPSQSPGHQVFSTPEAELGAQHAGLGEAPIAGYGGLLWLGQKWGINPRSFAKPSPVHALTALRLALNDPLEEALITSARLVKDDDDDAGWKRLNGAQGVIFEDTSAGLKSLAAAQKALRKHHVYLDVELNGITSDPKKRRALESAGANVYPSLSDALRAAGILSLFS